MSDSVPVEAYPTRELSARDIDTLAASMATDGILVRPHKDSGGIPAMVEVLESLHTVREERSGGILSRGTRNVSPAYSFEVRYAKEAVNSSNRVLSLQYVPADPGMGNALERRLSNYYPDCRMERRDVGFLEADAGDYLSGATLALRYYTLLPIRNIKLNEWRTDPTGSILQEMVGSQDESMADADVVVQTMFRPASRDWLQGVENGQGVLGPDDVTGQSREFAVQGAPGLKDLTYQLRQSTWERRPLLPFPLSLKFYEDLEHPPSSKAKDVAKMLEDQEGKAWELCVRIFAVSSDEEVARRRTAQTADMYRNFFEYKSEQTFVPQPYARGELLEGLTRGARREFEETGMIQTQMATAGLTNIPRAEDISTNKLRWSLAKPGDGVPPGTPRFNFEAAGIEATASNEDKQLAMLDGADVDGPYWYGFGSKHGVEVGAFPIHLDAHQFVNGATRKGKTTWLTNFASQVYRRGEGALIVDPKGKDAEEFIAEWPADRDEEDLIVYDLGDDDERIPRFNFMEVPSYLPEGSRARSSYVEALADDLTAMVADAGGSDKYLGALMKRVTKTLVRGLTKSGRTCTLLDLACAASSQENLATFRQWMDDERVAFIRDTAKRLEEKEDDSLEPLAGRLDEWIHNDAIRDLIAAREPSFSIHEAVNEGKVIIVRFPPGAGDTEKRLLTTALIRRTYVAQRQLDTQRPFHLICDEFDSVVSGASSIHAILSEAGAFKYRCTLACQNPSNQLPDRVKHAVENQCETWVSFNPGGGRAGGFIAQQHSEDIGKEELTSLPKYSFYFRTHDDDDNLTSSFMVDSFPPVREVRQRVRGQAPMADEEIRGLISRSLERYGSVPESADEQQAASPFIDGGAAPEAEPTAEVNDSADGAPSLLCKATYDESLRRGVSGHEWVAFDAVRERFARYRGADISLAAISAVLDETPEVEFRDSDGKRVRCTEAGKARFMPSGSAQTEGGPSHRQLLRDAYDGLVSLGLEVSLKEQSGAADVDGIGRIRETFDMGGIDPVENPAAFRDALDAFEREHPDLYAITGGRDVTLEAESQTSGKPAATIKNLAKAVAAGKRCVFLARPEDAEAVHRTLAEPPYVRAVDEDGSRRFYNRKRLVVGGEYVLRPNTAERTVWWERDGKVVCDDNENSGPHATFESIEDVFEDAAAGKFPAVESDVEEGAIGRDGEWRYVARPFIPDREFPDGELPGADEWCIVVVPREGEGELALYDPDAPAEDRPADPPRPGEKPEGSNDGRSPWDDLLADFEGDD